MKHSHAFLCTALTLLLLLLIACSSGSSLTAGAVPKPPTPGPAGGQDSPALEPAPQTRSVLKTSMPALAALTAGDEFTFTVSVDLSEPLFQACGRVVYRPELLEPLTVERGALIPAGDVFIAPLDAQPGAATLPAGMAAVPFAFTGLPGGDAIAAGSGELLQVRFRLRQPATGPGALYLLNNQEYLQLRDATGRRLAFDLATQEVGR